jgi:flagellin-like hook-associated protein FlgL
MESLSTGLKPNLSRQDPAGFVRGSQMAAHVRWQTEAVQNISNAGAMAGVADTGIERISDALLRIRELAIQATNATTDKDRSSLQLEVAQLVDSISSLSSDTKYNGIAVLGEYKDPFKFHTGASATDFRTHSIDSFRPQDIGAHSYTSEGDGALTAAASPSEVVRADNPSTMTVLNEKGQPTDINWRTNQPADEIAELINSESNITGVKANAVTRASLTSISSQADTYSLKINGYSTGNFSIRAGEGIAAAAAINRISGQTGVQAKFFDGAVLLEDRSGKDISIENARVGATFNSLQVQKIGWAGSANDLVGTAVSLDGSGANDSTVVSGSIKLSSNNVFSIHNTAAMGHFDDDQTQKITQDDTASITKDELSLVGGKLFRGNGKSADLVGLLDTAASDLANGVARFNFAYGLSEAGFDDEAAGSASFVKWDSHNQRVNLDGQTRISNHNLPVDSLLPSFTNGLLDAAGDATAPYEEATFSIQRVTDTSSASGFSVELQSGPIKVPSVGIVHGPVFESSETYALEAGDKLSFDWRGIAGTADYDVYAYAIDEETGVTQELLNATGSGGASSSWAVVNQSIETAGNYKVVFVGGVRSDEAVTFTNGDFEDGSAGDTVIPGWSTFTSQVRLNGIDTIAGQPSATDTIFPDNVVGAAPHDSASPNSATYTANLSTETSTGSGLSTQLKSSGVSLPGFGILHGPYLVSNDSVKLQPGDSVGFDWRATGGADAYDVVGYLVNENTGHVEQLLNETGETASANTPWATVSKNIEVGGDYRFVFVAGTWDATGGTAAGANLYVDNITVQAAAYPLVSRDASLRIDNIAVEKKSGNLDRAEFKDMADRLYGLGGDDGSSYSTVFAANYVEITSNAIVSDMATVSTIDISTSAGANAALSVIDGALAHSANNQAQLGALQSSIDFGMERLLQTSIQFESSKSRMMDADFALQSARLAREQMLQQMGSFVLSNTQEILRMSLSLLR